MVLQLIPGAEHVAAGYLAGGHLVFDESLVLLPSVRHAPRDGLAHFRLQTRDLEFLPDTDADFGEAGQPWFFRGMGQAELQSEVEDVEEFQGTLLLVGGERLDEIDRRCRLGCGFPEKGEERLQFVAGLDLFDVVEVAWVEVSTFP